MRRSRTGLVLTLAALVACQPAHEEQSSPASTSSSEAGVARAAATTEEELEESMPPAAEQADGKSRSSSPQEVIESIASADAEGRYAEILACVVPDVRETLVWATWFDAAYRSIGADPPVVERYQAILRQHELDEEWLDRDATGPGGVQKVAHEALDGKPLDSVFQDLMAFIRTLDADSPGFGFDGQVQDVEVDGEKATARIGEHTQEFARVDGTWYWVALSPDRG